MTINRQYEIVTRMGPLYGPQYIEAVMVTFQEMVRRWYNERWERQKNVILRKKVVDGTG